MTRRRVYAWTPYGSSPLYDDAALLAAEGLSEYTNRRACDECGVIEDVRVTTDYEREWWTCPDCGAEHTEIV